MARAICPQLSQNVRKPRIVGLCVPRGALRATSVNQKQADKKDDGAERVEADLIQMLEASKAQNKDKSKGGRSDGGGVSYLIIYLQRFRRQDGHGVE